MSTCHLHHLENSRSFRILWLLEELGIPYQLTTYERDRGLAPKSLEKVHPMGKAPILQDGDQTLVESAVIIEYLIDHYDRTDSAKESLEASQVPTKSISDLVMHKRLRPDYGTPAYEQYRYWLHFTESSLMPLLIIRLVFGKAVTQSPLGIRQIAKVLKKGVEKSYLTPSLTKQLDMLDQHLGKHPWVAGQQFSGADIQLEFGIHALELTHALPNKYANLHNWLKKCQNRPAYQRAVDKGGNVSF